MSCVAPNVLYSVKGFFNIQENRSILSLKFRVTWSVSLMHWRVVLWRAWKVKRLVVLLVSGDGHSWKHFDELFKNKEEANHWYCWKQLSE